ncbi:hypothetical protein [Rugamonas sp.]|uniref:hypothetical protein n=1 Tax=Rugamonas sp. TaxID=1926287 RepID=UPI0025F9AD0F|nr:hypothetical protein [Rugamonas sp.]
MNGTPFYGVGVNYYDAFTRYVGTGKDTTWMAGLTTLQSYNVPFIRVNAIGFWAPDIKANYINNKATFYARLDTFMNEASKRHIGVILDVFWNWTGWTDMNGEHAAAIGDPNSATRKMMRTVAAEMVLRYKNHPALWGWEYANESTSLMDLPDAINNYQWLPHYSTDAKRGPADNYTAPQMLSAIADFSRTVRINDTVTPIFSGNARPRYDAYHLPKSWDPDSPQQVGQILTRDNVGTDTTSMHLYLTDETAAFGTDTVTKTVVAGNYSNTLAAIMARSKEVDAKGKLVDPRPFFLGEFGVSDADYGAAGAKTKFNQITDAILANKVPMSALWVFDLTSQNGTFNVTATNSRSYQLDKIKAMNATMKTWTP